MEKHKVLITTNHMANISGSEIVALEVAECFRSFSCEVSICANQIGSPMKEVVAESGINLLEASKELNPFDFDIIWSQHHALSPLIAEHVKATQKKPYFIYAHLSPYVAMELPGPIIEPIFADCILANSTETLNKLNEFFVSFPTENIKTFSNAAPKSFLSHNKVAFLKKVLLISNHPPEELLDAIQILKNEYDLSVTHFGLNGTYERLEPHHLQEHDAVITIGKSVQYSILSLRPVYCYDHFGGPGWLTENNFELAEKFNYSGRCTNRKISAEQLAKEFISGFDQAIFDICNIQKSRLDQYILENHISKIVEHSKKEIKNLSQKEILQIKSEATLSSEVKNLYLHLSHILQQNKQLYDQLQQLQYQKEKRRKDKFFYKIKNRFKQLRRYSKKSLYFLH